MTIIDKTITQIAKFASKDLGRSALAQVLIDPAKGRAVCTDGHRLQMVDLPRTDAAPETDTPKAFGLPANQLAKIKGEVEVIPNGTQATLQSDTSAVVLPLVDETFPDYEQVLPQDNTFVIAVNAKYLAEAASYLARHATDKKKPTVRLAIKFDADGKPDSLMPMTLDAEVGEDCRTATHVLMPVRV